MAIGADRNPLALAADRLRFSGWVISVIFYATNGTCRHAGGWCIRQRSRNRNHEFQRQQRPQQLPPSRPRQLPDGTLLITRCKARPQQISASNGAGAAMAATSTGFGVCLSQSNSASAYTFGTTPAAETVFAMPPASVHLYCSAPHRINITASRCRLIALSTRTSKCRWCNQFTLVKATGSEKTPSPSIDRGLCRRCHRHYQRCIRRDGGNRRWQGPIAG